MTRPWRGREDLGDGAGLAVAADRQDHALVAPFHGLSPRVASPMLAQALLGPPAQFSRTFTNRNRWTLRLELPLHLLARQLADELDRLAALAEHDGLLAVALDIDHLVDLDGAVLALLPGLGLDGGGIGQLLVQALVDLLARHLGGHEAELHVGHLVFRIEPRALRHAWPR